MPRRHRGQQEHEVSVLQIRGEVGGAADPAVQRVLPREVHERGMPALDHRGAEPLGQRDEVLDRALRASGFLGDDHGVRGGGEEAGQLDDRRR